MTKSAKSIDLGAMQDALTSARKLHESNTKALANAQNAYDRSKEAARGAHEALKSAVQNVLS